MIELRRLIDECAVTRAFHVSQRNRGVRGAGIEALACAIRERALREAMQCVAADIVAAKKQAKAPSQT